MRKLTNIMVTGGAGFIGSNFIKYLFNDAGFKGTIVNVDSLTYAGNPEFLGGLPEEKMHCSVMGNEALEKAIRVWRGEKVTDHVDVEGEIICHCFGVTENLYIIFLI